jgi:hypothetical protein
LAEMKAGHLGLAAQALVFEQVVDAAHGGQLG